MFLQGEPIIRTWIDVTRLNAGGNELVRWRSAWWNRYVADRSISQLLVSGYQLPGLPLSLIESQALFDTVHTDLTVADGVVYTIEGEPNARFPGAAETANQEGFQYGQMLRRARKNRLAAYDAVTGKTLWAKAIALQSDTEPVGVLATPTVRGEMLLVPVTDGSSVHLAAVSRTDGRLLWSTYLCDEPAAGSSPMSRPAILVMGRDAYVLCGTGVLFCVDAEYGDTRFAVRYERNAKDIANLVNSNISGMSELSGWSRDELFHVGNTLVLFPSDHDGLLAFDTTSLKVRWKSPRTPLNLPADRAVGVVGDGLFVAGPTCVRRYEISSGRLLWETVTPPQTGMALIVSDGILVPSQQDVIHLDAQNGTVVKTTPVQLPDGDYVGNLATDGATLWSVGVSWLTRLEPANPRPRTADKASTPESSGQQGGPGTPDADPSDTMTLDPAPETPTVPDESASEEPEIDPSHYLIPRELPVPTTGDILP